MATQPPNITPVPTPPIQRGDRATFSGRVDAFIIWLTNAVGQFGAVATNVYNNALEALQSSQSATASAVIASAAASDAVIIAGANPWVSGTTYQKNVAVISQVNFQTYRRMVAGAGTTDPANDTGAVWMPLFGNGSFTPRAASTATFDLSTTNFFTRAMSNSETWVLDKCPTNGFSFGVELAYTGGTLTLPTSVKTPNNIVYSFAAGKTYLLLFITTNKGARWRMAVTEAYDN